MSVFKRPGATVYSYDFRVRGRRFSGTTGCETKRDAERWEKAERARVKTAEIDTAKPLTFAAASSLYWHEVGQHHADAIGTERHLAWLQNQIGPTTMLVDVNSALLAKLVARRRGETVRRVRDGKVQEVHLAPATVNRSVTEMLRKILHRADRVWGAKVARIQWKDHLLAEPQERVREATQAEQEAALAAIPEDYAPALLFAILTGCRRVEIVGLVWQRVDFFNREFRVIGKRGLARTIPMAQAVYDMLWALKDDHPEAVFTYVAKRASKHHARGERCPITMAGFQTAWRRHARPVLNDFKFHDTRHTAATRLVRATGNIRLAQRLLGHSSVATTTRYAHVTHDDLRKGLEDATRAERNTDFTTEHEQSADNELNGMKKPGGV